MIKSADGVNLNLEVIVDETMFDEEMQPCQNNEHKEQMKRPPKFMNVGDNLDKKVIL